MPLDENFWVWIRKLQLKNATEKVEFIDMNKPDE